MEAVGNWQDSESEHDIYGDLESSIFTTSRHVKHPADEAQIESLLKDNGELKRELQKLRRENQILLRNISSLHLTAKNEIEKKNFLINELQKKLKDTITSKHGNKMSKKECDGVLQKCEEAYFESHSKVTLEEIKRALRENREMKSEKDCNTKCFKFGNMSYYFINHQNPCHRNEQIEFPIGKSDSNNLTSKQKSAKPKEETSHNDANCTPCGNSKHASRKADGIKMNVGDNSIESVRGDDKKYLYKDSSSKATYKEETSKAKDENENGVGKERHANVRKSPRHLKNIKSRSSSRDESRHSRKHTKTSERSLSRSENVYKKHYERKRSRERSCRGDSRSDSPHPYSERASRPSSTRSSKRHRREIS